MNVVKSLDLKIKKGKAIKITIINNSKFFINAPHQPLKTHL